MIFLVVAFFSRQLLLIVQCMPCCPATTVHSACTSVFTLANKLMMRMMMMMMMMMTVNSKVNKNAQQRYPKSNNRQRIPRKPVGQAKPCFKRYVSTFIKGRAKLFDNHNRRGRHAKIFG